MEVTLLSLKKNSHGLDGNTGREWRWRQRWRKKEREVIAAVRRRFGKKGESGRRRRHRRLRERGKRRRGRWAGEGDSG
ncbi:hypothetical protein TIFTF001_040035 [Ficus carica]|uniref:Uncharacterized protein n=1 Tax=Ficus carica TaxID=3494 RepID=A0AA88CI16_FICCA|nr:hypothetical protein TIFTF001_040025 [Ficus carica]GMN21106.1 hypothetical protein TIFTF001_040029 [Ficus carica]GMN21113.1 hypothetical protein TIFTF001_040031 [Ficus carica]GMN21132.1 hypothetical protein TIFTF001_040035 [Ficus carica]